ncbi:VanZ family protein [Sabulilitoribacter multivorans]|uniref:VanZ family protein n=1 Tax=Flaviramulus multivorans TaxID=1304750 RepID=A0ABS9IEQ4_9FLAO|nr:VanZ family protein [Flaviramulus multivorans]
MLKKFALIIAIFYSLVLAFVSLIKLNNLPDVGVSFGDKIFHFLAYFVLTFLWFNTFINTYKFKNRRAIIFSIVISVVFGIIIEVLQETITVSRALDIYDVLANTIGVLIASLVLWVKHILQVKNS